MQRYLPLVLLILSFHFRSLAGITGHWSFEAGDLFLSAKIGDPMLEIDVDTAFNEQFGTTGQGAFAGVPNIGGQPVAVMMFPKTTATGGYFVPPGTTANGGGANINQYTIIMDILFPADSSGKTRALLQTDGIGNAEFLVNEANQIGTDGGTFAGNLTPDTWHRVAIAVDLAAVPPSVAYFINGVKVFEGNPGGGVDGRLAVLPSSVSTYAFLYFANDALGRTEAGYLSSLQFRDERVPDSVLIALGGPTPDGILTGALPNPYLILAIPSATTAIIPDRSTVPPTPLIQAVIVDGTNAVDTSTVTMQLNGQPVDAEIVKVGGTNTISYTPTNLLAAGSINTVRIDYEGLDGTPYVTQWQFAVGRYVGLPADAAAPLGSANTPGFVVRTVQASTTNVIANEKNFSRAIRQLNGTLHDLSGELVPNLATPGTNPNGSFNVSTINFHLGGADFGVFAGDAAFPGIPGSEASTDRFATEVLAYLELTEGIHTFGVSVATARTDVNDDDGYTLFSGKDPQSALAPIIGSFDRGTVAAFAESFTTNRFRVVVPVTGIYPVRLVHFQTGRDSSLEFYSVDEATGEDILINDPVDSRAIKAYRVSTAPASNKPHVVQIDPPPGASGVSPLLPIEVLVLDDQTQVDLASIRLSLNGVDVSAATTKNKVNGRTTITYQPNATRTVSTNELRLVFSDNASPTPRSYTNDWAFTITASAVAGTTATGQWDFDAGDLSATIGKPLRYFDGPTGNTAAGTQFGTCSSFGVPLINGEDAHIMYVPGDTGPGSRNIAYVMEHGIAPNGGGTRVNQYTLIFDVFLVDGSGAGAMLQVTDPEVNQTDGDLFWQDNNFGQGGQGYIGRGTFTPGVWHRVIAAYDEAAIPPVVTKFVDGIKQHDWTANQGLDNNRRAMLPTALLFADGDEDERREWYVNSIQVRDGKLTDAEMVALGGPTADGIPVSIPASTATGQWDFEFGDLGASVGKALRYFDGTNGLTAAGTQFGTCSSFGVPLINGEDAHIMYVPGDTGPGSRNIAYVMEHGIAPNGGGTRVNQYTLIFDVFLVEGSGAGAMLQVTDPEVNQTDGDLFWQDNNFGQGGGGYIGRGTFTPGGWHRVIAAYDEAATPPVVTKFVDGIKQDEWTANQGLDNNRRTLLPTALLFADGDEDERRAWYVNSIQVRDGRLTDAEMVALGGPTADGIPVSIPASTATGQWDFEFSDLGATVGKALRYFDGTNGLTAAGTQFGTCSLFGVPLINGEDAHIMYVPGDTGPGSRNIAYVMEHGIAPNGGGTRVNQYTLIFDVFLVEGSGAGAMLQVTDPEVNQTDGDLFWQGNNFGQGDGGYNGTGAFTPGTWHRVIAAYNEAAIPPVVTKYVDGIFQDEWTANQGLDNNRRTLLPTALLFADGDEDERRAWYVNSIQIREGALSKAAMEWLGGPSAAGIPVVIDLPPAPPPTSITFSRSGNSLTLSWPLTETGYTLQSSPSLSAPDWQPVTGVVGNSVTVQMTDNTRYYRLFKP